MCGAFLATLWVVAFAGSAAGESPYAALKEALLKNGYDPDVRPGGPTEPVQVEMSLNVNAIRVEEWNVALRADGWLVLTWKDARLAWDPTAFSQVDKIRLPASAVWIPDITLGNQIPSTDTTNAAQQYQVLVYNNGTVLWVPSVPLATTCFLELSNFPKDVQKCTMMFGSWVYDKTEIDLHLYREGLTMDYLVNTSPWVVTGASAEEKDMVYPGVFGVYPSVFYTFTLERRTGFYCLTLYLPILVSVLTSIASWLVSKNGASGAELTIGSLVNIAILFWTTHFHSQVLKVSESGAPMILQFVGALIALEALTLPWKVLHAGFAKKVEKIARKANPNGKPFSCVFSAFPILSKFGSKMGAEQAKLDSDDDKKILLTTEGGVTQTNVVTWKRCVCMSWTTLTLTHAIGLTIAAIKLFPCGGN
jgi:hypothetical protein